MPAAAQPGSGGPALTVSPDQDLRDVLEDAPEGAVVTLTPGVYAAGLAVSRSVHLRASEAGAVTLDGDGRGAVVWVDADGIDVTLTGLQLTNGHAGAGGAVSLRGFSTLTLRDCEISGSHAREGAGDAVFADAGTLALHDTRVRGGGRAAGALVLATGVATLRLCRCELSAAGTAALALKDHVEATVEDCALRNGGGPGVTVAGTRSRRPEVVIRRGSVDAAPSLSLRARFPGRVRVVDTALSTPADGVYIPRELSTDEAAS